MEEAAAAGALAPLPLAELEREGLVERVGGRARARFRVQPYDGLLVASDRDDGTTPLAPDHVMAVTPSTRVAAALTVRRPVDDALDLCTGGGLHALLAARHAGRVVATDLNPRALELARLSERLSGVEGVDWRLGDLFAPVADERFDLVVANPPFVLGPARELWLRDGGAHGDPV